MQQWQELGHIQTLSHTFCGVAAARTSDLMLSESCASLALLSPSTWSSAPHFLVGPHLPIHPYSPLPGPSSLQGLFPQLLVLITQQCRGASGRRGTRRIREGSWLVEAERLLSKPLDFQLRGPHSAQARMPGRAPGCFLGQEGGLLPSNTFPEELPRGWSASAGVFRDRRQGKHHRG